MSPISRFATDNFFNTRSFESALGDQSNPVAKLVCFVLLCVLFSIPWNSWGQPSPIPFHKEAYELDSGFHDGPRDLDEGRVSQTPKFSATVRVDDAPWIRLHFGEVRLGKNSYLSITSLEDKSIQRHTAETLEEWNNTSAYFNGEAVKIELYVAGGEERAFFRLTEVSVGERGQSASKTSTICGTSDDRSSSSDEAVGRLVSGVCTGWIISNGALLTAGHCVGAFDTIQFNVPASDSDGTINHPPASDQYALDSVTDASNTSVGDDWAVFDVHENSNTGKTPIQKQQAFYRLSRDINPTSIRVTGYGNDANPPGPSPPKYLNSDSNTLQTHAGSNEGETTVSANVVYWAHKADTERGNSGSPLISNGTGISVGIHTDGGCTVPGTLANFGTSFENDDLEDAINSFLGSNIVHVDPGHPSASEDGSILRPYDTISEAVTAASSGDIISFTDGSYVTDFTISKDLTLHVPLGTIALGKWTVSSGNSLTIMKGATIEFATNKGIFANGDVFITGTEDQKVILKKTSGGGRWDYVYAREDVTIRNVEISGSDYGIHTNNPGNVVIEDVTATNNYYNGLKLYNTSSAGVESSTFSGNTLYGVYIDDSDNISFESGNIFNDNEDGIRVRGNSTAYFGASSQAANVEVSFNDEYGLHVYLDSYLLAGDDSPSFGGYSNIFGNQTNDARADNGGEILAENIYWGNAPPLSGQFYVGGGGSSIDYTPWLTTSAKTAVPDDPVASLTPAQFVRQVYELARTDRSQAKEMMKTSRDHPKPSIARKAKMLYLRETLKEDPSQGVGYGEELLRQDGFSMEEQAMIAKQLYYAYLFELNDSEEADTLLNVLHQLQDEDVGTGLLETVFEDVTGQAPNVHPALAARMMGKEGVLRNYPNPFNPTTTIQYALTERAPVRLRVYDVLGREVARLVHESQAAGVHQVPFDGSNLGSGMYMYRLEIADEVFTGRMHLIK